MGDEKMAKSSELVKANDYIVIQRQDYFKLHRITPNGTASLGKDVLDIGTVIGKPYWSTFRMEQKKGGKRNYQLKECTFDNLKEDSITLNNTGSVPSGTDNRNIVDDGNSQKLSMEEIVNLRGEGLSSKEIVGTLIENSTTFQNKTEYSQQKYLKKKEKKYFEYIVIRKPTVRLIAEIMFRQDQGKILGLRVDTLSQLTTAVNLHSHGTYILYESGCQGLAAAAMLNGICGEGRLLLVHPGNYPQKHALLSLNLSEEQENSLICVNIYNLLRKLQIESKPNSNEQEQDSSANSESVCISATGFNNESAVSAKEGGEELGSSDNLENKSNTSEAKTDVLDQSPVEIEQENCTLGKRKHSDNMNDDGSANKKSRWEAETDKAASALNSKADGLIIVCREHPSSIVNALLPFVAPSRNFVVYGQTREPLQELLTDLSKRPDIINLKLTDSWLRNYQVETNRTHPLVNMSGGGGYLLTGVVVENISR